MPVVQKRCKAWHTINKEAQQIFDIAIGSVASNFNSLFLISLLSSSLESEIFPKNLSIYLDSKGTVNIREFSCQGFLRIN